MEMKMLCMGCMREKNEDEEYCPYCGYRYDESDAFISSRGLRPGIVLNGKYLVGKILGEGGFGITYIGMDTILETRVAIKEYFPAELATRDMSDGTRTFVSVITGDKAEHYQKGLERFVKEAENLAKFNDLPGIVSVKDFFYENNTAYMVMEYIDGITLSQYLSENGNKLSYDQVINLMKPVMGSLQTVHEAGIIHRDISPDNIMITKEGEMKLIDFGASRFVGNNDAKSLTVILKHGYAPPEQYQTDGKQGPWTDVYALAATMYRMITGEVPQEATDRMVSQDKLQAVNTIVSDAPKNISDVIIKGMSLKIEKRISSVKEMADMLSGGSKFLHKKGFIAGVIAAVAVICALVGGIVYFSGRSNEGNRDGDTVAETEKDGNTDSDSNTETSVKGDKYTESELLALISKECSSKPVASCYHDFDMDGANELFAVEQYDQDGIMECRFWEADEDGNVSRFEDRRKEQMTGSFIESGMLQFSNVDHYYIKCEDEEGNASLHSFGCRDGKVAEIYAGDAELVNDGGKIYSVEVEDKEEWSKEEQRTIHIVTERKCEILYEDGVYAGLGCNILNPDEIRSIDGAKEALEHGLDELKDMERDYPYQVPMLGYYCANEHIYVAVQNFANESDYLQAQDELYPWESIWEYESNYAGVSDLDFILAAAAREKKYIDLLYDGKKVCYEGIVDAIPDRSETFHNICRKFQPYAYDEETWDDSEDNLQRILFEHIGFMDNENIAWDYYETIYNGFDMYNTRMETLYDDFDNDGKNEMYMMVLASDKRYEPMAPADGVAGILMLICCADENGVATIGFQDTYATSNSLTECVFGKDKICLYEEDPYHGMNFRENECYELSDKNIYVVKIYGKPAQKDGVVRCDFISDPFPPFVTESEISLEITLWYIDREFVECASVEIERDDFLQYDGAETIIQNLNEIIFDNMDEWDKELLNNEVHYSIKNILLCGDNHIYVNCGAIDKDGHKYEYNDGYNDYGYNCDVVLYFELKENSVEYLSQTWGERKCHVSDYKPYYPALDD